MLGLTSSPFILNRTIQRHLNKFLCSNPKFIKKILPDWYVDDLVCGCDSLSDGVQFYHTAKDIMLKGGLELRKWTTSNLDLQNHINNMEGINFNNDKYSKYDKVNINTSLNIKMILENDWDIKLISLCLSFNHF